MEVQILLHLEPDFFSGSKCKRLQRTAGNSSKKKLQFDAIAYS
ncbi:hypothetical protein HJ01_03492 [Flavobacterium frigoris PS1]|uniref:Uncharacterized protein n=1 Tax=Flavobacterium frigoris (strain PS1) TaxID=1086011 RepID=H7FWE5_FLAFP|nr:hypothetical protein HJ01_03492 [Flavobacterium frigoris PS1]